jgi:hypothetical protein
MPVEDQRSQRVMKSPVASVLIASLFIFGCSTVTVKQPLGEKLPARELKSLEGTWNDQQGQTLEIHALPNGQLAFGSLAWDDKAQQFKLETGELVLTRAGSLTFVAIPGDDTDRYTLALCGLLDKDTVSFHLPVVDVFEKAIADQKLEGSIKKREHDRIVNLDAPPEKVVEFITRTGVEKCFVDTPEDSVVYRRVSRR